ncbi:MAG TPA: (E)-4-hydroxy-3-methylbut-2-enyl-diphosphate synthase [Cytophagaceae bacterium]
MDLLVPEEKTVIYKYNDSLTEYKRRATRVVKIGDVPVGGDYPIRIQSMTTVDTMDTSGSVEQCIRMIEAGCEYIRITAPSVNEAKNLENIKEGLKRKGFNVPLIADIHFTPNAAEVAARIVEKVRINPGNYADKKRFEVIEYTDSTYQAELERIRERFVPLVKICKEYGTAMRIGTNHGSLSDRILSRYGDTPLGMVESALEFVRICEDLNYYDIVLSMKASNTQVMVQAYRLLVQKLKEENLKPYPLHLGVTEAGEGEDGRIKSAVGIGTLLEDGLGDTIRVSLTEEPEFEAPVAKMLVDRYTKRAGHKSIKPIATSPVNPFQYSRRQTIEVLNIGGGNVPRVIADLNKVSDIQLEDLKAIGHYYLPLLDKWNMNDLGADYVYTGRNKIPFMLPNGLKEILDYEQWVNHAETASVYPLMRVADYTASGKRHADMNFLKLELEELNDALLTQLKEDKSVVIVLDTYNLHAMPEQRRAFFELLEKGIESPVIILRKYPDMNEEQLQLYAATDMGGLLIDGLGDGVWISSELTNAVDKEEYLKLVKCFNNTSFGILQAARTRMSKTEYISCPSCGRTLFDLQETTAMIRKRTDHLKGIKIGIMGCIVNGPGEMADADYGYVGVGKGKIALYRGQNVVKRSVPSENAVDELIELIREDGKWTDPVNIEE